MGLWVGGAVYEFAPREYSFSVGDRVYLNNWRYKKHLCRIEAFLGSSAKLSHQDEIIFAPVAMLSVPEVQLALW